MSQPVDFPGSTDVLAPPPGAENVTPLPVFRNGTCCVSCWQLTPAELQEIIDNGGRVFVSILSGRTQPPVYVGSESSVRELIADYGVWKR